MKAYEVHKTLSPTVVINMLCMIRHVLEVVDKFKQAAQRTQKNVSIADIFSEVQGKWKREDLVTMQTTLLVIRDLTKLFLPACERAILDTDRANDDDERLRKYYQEQA